jgi:hypothetical protein
VSAESEVRDALVAHAPLIAVVPAASISVDGADQGIDRPYIAFASQGYSADLGLDNTLLGTATTLDILCVGETRADSIVIRDLVRDALLAAGLPSDRGNAGFDPELQLEVEVVTVDWFDV